MHSLHIPIPQHTSVSVNSQTLTPSPSSSDTYLWPRSSIASSPFNAHTCSTTLYNLHTCTCTCTCMCTSHSNAIMCVQLRRQARLRREYLYRKSVEDQERTILERKRKIQTAIEGTCIYWSQTSIDTHSVNVHESSIILFIVGHCLGMECF